MQGAIRLLFATAALCCARAEGATFCVSDAAGLQTALTSAAGNGDAQNTIKVRSGTYLASGSGFSHSRFSGTSSLDIEGGWNAGCTTQTPDTSLTVLDGQSTAPILSATNYLATGGDMTLRYLTFLHGATAASSQAAALTLVARGFARVESCRFRLNQTDAAGAGYGTVHVAVVDGPIQFINNIVANNSALGSQFVAGFDFASGASTVVIQLNDNTIADNAFDTTDQTAGAVFLTPIATSSLANNILWGNGGAEFDQNITLTPLMLNNDVDVLNVTPGPGSGGNRNQNPQFVNVNNHHLQATSPLYNAGYNAPPGGDGAVDLDGNPRVQFGTIDIGAYEMQVQPDLIFVDGFDGT